MKTSEKLRRAGIVPPPRKGPRPQNAPRSATFGHRPTRTADKATAINEQRS